LQELDDLTEGVASVPDDRQSPGNVSQNAYQADGQICELKATLSVVSASAVCHTHVYKGKR
jgi:hypothetical protein